MDNNNDIRREPHEKNKNTYIGRYKWNECLI